MSHVPTPGRSLSQSCGRDSNTSTALPPSATVALPKPNPELMAMLSRAAERVGHQSVGLRHIPNPRGRMIGFLWLPAWAYLADMCEPDKV